MDAGYGGEVARAESVVFVDCAINAPPPEQYESCKFKLREFGRVSATHHVGAAELLGLGEELYGSLPGHALLLTIGAGATEVGESSAQL